MSRTTQISGASWAVAWREDRHPTMRPLRDPLRSLIYTAAERAVRDVYVDGRQVVREGKVLTSDYGGACDALEAAQARALERAPKFDWAHRDADALVSTVLPMVGP